MLRPPKRQKFGGFRLEEEKKPLALEEVLEEPPESQEEREEEGGEAVRTQDQRRVPLKVGALGVGAKTPAADPSESREGVPAAAPTLASLLARAEAAAADDDVEAAFEALGAESEAEGAEERELLDGLREALAEALPTRQFELEPAGAFAAGLRVPTSGGKSPQGDLEVVLVFHDSMVEDEELASGMVDSVAALLRGLPGTVLKDVDRKARHPTLRFETKLLAVELSMHNPFGVLDSWHLRELCRSGCPGRLRALARLVKLWARSKAVDVAKDGTLSPRCYELLAAVYLREGGAVPALPQEGVGPYVEPEDALRHLLDACTAGGAAQCSLWGPPDLTPADSSEAAGRHPAELLLLWLDWMGDRVLGFVESCKDVAGGCGRAPLERRYIASVRDRTQEELREDVLVSPVAAEHWAPATQEVFLLVEEPLSGANAGRSCSFKGFCTLRAEVQRARKFFETAPRSRAGLPNLQALFALAALSRGQPALSKAQPQSHLQPPRPVGAVQQGAAPPEDSRVADGGSFDSRVKSLASLCWDFARGTCKKGASCKWVHSVDAGALQVDL